MKKKIALILTLLVIVISIVGCSYEDIVGCSYADRGLSGYPDEVKYIIETENVWYGADKYEMLDNRAIVLDGYFVCYATFGKWYFCDDKITLYYYEKITEVRR